MKETSFYSVPKVISALGFLSHPFPHSETEKFFFKDVRVCHDISRNRKTIVYSMSCAKEVCFCCEIVIIFSSIISIIQKKKLGIPKLCL